MQKEKKLTIHDSGSYNRFRQSKAEFTLDTQQSDEYRREATAITRQLFKGHASAKRKAKKANQKEWFENHPR